MNETTHEAPTDRPVRVLRDPADAAAAPAVLVTAWLLAELADSAVLVEQVGPAELHLRSADATVAGRLDTVVGDVLDDVRFTGWAVASSADMTRTLLVRDVPTHVAEADTS